MQPDPFGHTVRRPVECVFCVAVEPQETGFIPV